MTWPPGISGTLFPRHYLAGMMVPGDRPPADEAARRRLEKWWAHVVATSGSADGPRAVFDVVAMPLFGMLGFRARDAIFESRQASARLESRAGAVVGLIVRPWAQRAPVLWRDVSNLAREVGAAWCFVLAPPFLSLVDARGHALRRSVDFTLPDVFTAASYACFRLMCQPQSFDSQSVPGARTRIDSFVLAASRLQDRVARDLQSGVEQAVGQIRHATDADQSLTVVYRILFLLFAESRGLVPIDSQIYRRSYSVSCLAKEASASTSGVGWWDALGAITRLSRLGCRTAYLIVRPFNGRLFAKASAPSLEERPRARKGRRTSVRDAAMRDALCSLTTRSTGSGRLEISYSDLGVEQLGAIYERILDLRDVVEPSTASARRHEPTRAAHSPRRKETGTFYTPQPLAEYVVRRTLAPLVAGASADAILGLRVVDPAMGSGAFLVAACRYLSEAYEGALVEEGRASSTDFDDDARASIRRRIAAHCLIGVDLNPVAVQLAQLSLWLATLARGRPLGFLDHRLRVGNSLVGISPHDLRRRPSRRSARSEAPSLPLFDEQDLDAAMRSVAGPLIDLRRGAEESVQDIRAKEQTWRELMSSHSPLHRWRTACHVWTARWFWNGANAPSGAEVGALLDAVLHGDRTLSDRHVRERLDVAASLAECHRFFHWPLEFADVFYDESGQPKTNAGFDAVIGNPPWEMLRRDSRERSLQDRPSDRSGGTDESLSPARLVRFIRDAGVYSACRTGHVNLYQPFVERFVALAKPKGRIGLVLPWGFAADDGAADLRRMLFRDCVVDTLVGLDNAAGMFPIHRGVRFLVACAGIGGPTRVTKGCLGVRTLAEVDRLPERDDPFHSSYPVTLTTKTLSIVGGPTLRIPDVRTADDLELLERCMKRFPALGSADGWGARFGRELNATEDRSAFGKEGLPVIEGKHLIPFGTDVARAQCRIPATEARTRLPDRRFEHPRLGYRDVSAVSNRQTLVAALVPAGVVTTHTIFCLRSKLSRESQEFLCGVFNSFVLNAIVRLLMGSHLTTSLVEGLPVPRPGNPSALGRIAALSRACGTDASARPDLDAAIAHLYGIERASFARILNGFPLVPRDDRERTLLAFDRSSSTSART